MPKTPADGEAPKKLSTYTLKLDEAQMGKLRAVLEGRGWERFEVAYARFAFRGRDCNVTAYESGKVVVAGKGTEDFVLHTLEGEVTQAPRLGYDAVLHPDWYEAHAGLDESGKGDFFGPVVAATVIANPAAIEAWVKAGVKDSKKIAEPQILALDALIRRTPGAAVASAQCGMPRYNELMARPYASLNKLLGWLHATALSQALAQQPVAWGVLDQFSEQPYTQLVLETRDVAAHGRLGGSECARRRRVAPHPGHVEEIRRVREFKRREVIVAHVQQCVTKTDHCCLAA